MSDTALAVAALIAGGCTLALAAIVARVIREGTVHEGAAPAVRAALAESSEWVAYRCGCGEWVWTAADARTVRGERACTYCYLGSEECAEAERERADDLRLHSMLDGGGR